MDLAFFSKLIWRLAAAEKLKFDKKNICLFKRRLIFEQASITFLSTKPVKILFFFFFVRFNISYLCFIKD